MDGEAGDRGFLIAIFGEQPLFFDFQCKVAYNKRVEELKEAGLNRSDVHVDFMIGSNKMNIDGIRADGTRVPIFRDGEWAI